MCSIYVPSYYLLSAIEALHADEPHIGARVYAFAEQYFAEHMLPNENACIEAARANKMTSRAMVFAVNGVAPEYGRRSDLANCDEWLDALATFYERLREAQIAFVEGTLSNYDLDGDGSISLDEFLLMLPEVHDLKMYPMSDAEQEALYENLMSLGDGYIRQGDLNQLLFIASTKVTAAKRMSGTHGLSMTMSGPDAADPAARAAQLTSLVAMWDTARKSCDDELTAAARRMQNAWRVRRFRRVARSLRHQGAQVVKQGAQVVTHGAQDVSMHQPGEVESAPPSEFAVHMQRRAAPLGGGGRSLGSSSGVGGVVTRRHT